MAKDRNQAQKSRILTQAANAATRKMSKTRARAAAKFIRQYYQDVPAQDAVAGTAANLGGAALAHRAFGARRRAGQSLVRAYNPTPKKDGWDSPFTVLEIVTDDMPFLVDSVTAAVNAQNLVVHLVVHPVFQVTRDGQGKLLDAVLRRNQTNAGARRESFMRLDITALAGGRLDEITKTVRAVLGDVRAAVRDWQAMRDRMEAAIDGYSQASPGVSAAVADETRAFLRWVHDNHFTFLGASDFTLSGTGEKTRARTKAGSGLGVLRNADAAACRQLCGLAGLSAARSLDGAGADSVLIAKTDEISSVHRPVLMDAIFIKKMNAQGKVVGQRIFVGLFTSTAYSDSPRNIPLLRHKIQNVVKRAGYDADSHAGKALLNVLETYPRDELYQIGEEALLETGLGILNLQERQRLALFVRPDAFGRFLSCQIFIPRDSYNMALRQRIQEILEETFAGEVAGHYIEFGDSPLARLHVNIRTAPGKVPSYNVVRLEARLRQIARSWTGKLADALTAAHGEAYALSVMERYREAFGSGYQDTFGASRAMADLAKVEEVYATGRLGMALRRPKGYLDNELRFKVYKPGESVPLSDVIPILENMGLRVIDEKPFRVRPAGTPHRVMIHDFGLETRNGAPVNIAAIEKNFEEVFGRAWDGEVESDGFNALVLEAGLAWREVVILRAYAKYLRQAAIPYSQAYMEQTLNNNPALTRGIVDLFGALFDPAKAAAGAALAGRVRRKLTQGLEQVTSADEDRIISRFINAVESTLRTNFFQTAADGGPKAYVSFKLDSRSIEDLPLPRPLREISVYSPRVEGVHLRFGMVARGGLRWSDRPEDFRTEVLGLVKAQQVKNAVIVPVGSKGGFVVKQPPADGGREAFINEGIACYKTFIAGLLDITDNLKGGQVVPPKTTVRRDGDDPYLVVAADKGTATFSDIANGVSADYGFWLGDAFASGGSVGYDHKKMGITARGAWESVKRHFREMGINTQKEDFTVVGVGDMSGDVFGNGMLLSPHIKLLAAFNHLHIFVDPDPDPAAGLAERRRLFRLPRSSWGDYDASRISTGGGVFERSAKSLSLSKEIRDCFGISEAALTPNEFLRRLLTADVGLLWFGGIGTYIKASSESNGDVGDRANDAIRINGADVRAKVIGEGANLGVTQRGRIEYGLSGGRLNSDSIDNSAGVDCSDHEVNIKILIDAVVAKGGLSGKQRNKQLAVMTNEVGNLCLVDNYLQTQAISASQSLGVAVLDDHNRLMRTLERRGILNRSVEFLPDEEAVAERKKAGKGLTRPETGVLLSYSKNWLFSELLGSDFPDDPFLADDLMTYFPTPLRDKYRADILRHRLRREIIATVAANVTVNRAGETFVTRFMEKTGMSSVDITRAFTVVRHVFGLDSLWQGVEALDNRAPAETQNAMLLEIGHLVEWATLWFLRNGQRLQNIGAAVADFQPGVREMAQNPDKAQPLHYLKEIKERARPLTAAGVPEKLALKISALVNLFTACDIVLLAESRRLPVTHVSQLYYYCASKFRLGRLRAAAEGLDSSTHWQKLAIGALVEEIYGHQLALTTQVLDFAGGKIPPEPALNKWLEHNREAVAQADQLLAELWSSGVSDLSMIAVASRQLRSLADTVGTT